MTAKTIVAETMVSLDVTLEPFLLTGVDPRRVRRIQVQQTNGVLAEDSSRSRRGAVPSAVPHENSSSAPERFKTPTSRTPRPLSLPSEAEMSYSVAGCGNRHQGYDVSHARSTHLVIVSDRQ